MSQLAQRLNALVEAMISDFLAGDYAPLTAHYDFPLALHLEDRLIVLHRAEDMVRWFQVTAAARAAEGMAGLTGRVVATDLPRHHRFRAWVSYSHLDAEGREIGKSARIFYCRDRAGSIRIEMLHVTKLAVSELRHWPELYRRKI
jgi:hypothetical protein